MTTPITTQKAPRRTDRYPSVLRTLRQLAPHRALTFNEARRLAELQATRLVRLLDAVDDGIQEHHIADLPRIRIVYADLPPDAGGASHWSGDEWIITLARDNPITRQRFSLLHEYKHIIDHGQMHLLYTGSAGLTPTEQAEKAADYFAGCALVSKQALKRAWGNRLQRIDDLAQHFGVGPQAIQVRLAQTGLSRASDEQRPGRCGRAPSFTRPARPPAPVALTRRTA